MHVYPKTSDNYTTPNCIIPPVKRTMQIAKTKVGSLGGWLGRPTCRILTHKSKVYMSCGQKCAEIAGQSSTTPNCINSLTTTSKNNQIAKTKVGSLGGWLGRPTCRILTHKSKVYMSCGQKCAEIAGQSSTTPNCINSLTTTSKNNQIAKTKVGSLGGWLGRPTCRILTHKSKVYI